VTVSTSRPCTDRHRLDDGGRRRRGERDHLTQLDAAIGDGDHGVNMTAASRRERGRADGRSRRRQR
jgi:dihydroxyacetone kinase